MKIKEKPDNNLYVLFFYKSSFPLQVEVRHGSSYMSQYLNYQVRQGIYGFEAILGIL